MRTKGLIIGNLYSSVTCVHCSFIMYRSTGIHSSPPHQSVSFPYTLTTATTTHLPGGRRLALPHSSPLSQPKQHSKYITIGVNADWLHSYVRVGTYVCTYRCIYVCSMHQAGSRRWGSSSSLDSIKQLRKNRCHHKMMLSRLIKGGMQQSTTPCCGVFNEE